MGRTKEGDIITPRRVGVKDDLDPRVPTVTRVEKVTATTQDAAGEAIGGGIAIHAPPPALDPAPDLSLPPSPDRYLITVPRDRRAGMVDAALAKTLV